MKKIQVNNKYTWGAAVVAAGVVVCFGLCGMFHNRTPRTITVTGECLTSAPKDRTAITLRVTKLNKSASASMSQAQFAMSGITSYLADKGVEVQTTEFNSYEKMEWNRDKQKSESLGIETTIAIEVSGKDSEVIENILSKFSGQTDVYTENLRMFSSAETIKPIMEKCLSVAMQNARERATAIASGDGVRVGKLMSVSYGNATHTSEPNTANFLRMAKVESAADSAVGAAPTIMAKDTNISVSVTAVFGLK